MNDIIKLYIIISIYKGLIKSEYKGTIVSEDNNIVLDAVNSVNAEIKRVIAIAYSDDIVKNNKRLLRDIFDYHLCSGLTESIADIDDFIDSAEYETMKNKLFEHEFIYM